MENEQPNAGKNNDEVLRKDDGTHSLVLPEAKPDDQNLQELTSVVGFFFLKRKSFWKAL